MTIVVMGVVVFVYFWWAKKHHDRYVDEQNDPLLRKPVSKGYPSSVRVVPPVRVRDWDREGWS